MIDLNLSGKRAIVSGSSQGIGRAIAFELADLGASVVLIARDQAALQQVKDKLRRAGEQQHDVCPADFSQTDGLSQHVEQILERYPRIDILVNNMGGPAGGPTLDAKPEEFMQTFSNHLVCNQILAQAVVPGMKDAGFGRIINIISTSVKQPIKGFGVSNTIRGAVANWAKTLAEELGIWGITVNNVLPGATSTARLESIIENRSRTSGATVEQITDQMKSEIPARRFAKPEEIAQAVAFLASPAAGYINGINLPVDGGRTLCL